MHMYATSCVSQGRAIGAADDGAVDERQIPLAARPDAALSVRPRAATEKGGWGLRDGRHASRRANGEPRRRPLRRMSALLCSGLKRCVLHACDACTDYSHRDSIDPLRWASSSGGIRTRRAQC